MVNRKDLKDKVPFGYGKKIAEKAGVTPQSVSDYLNGKSNSERIEVATLELLAELANRKKPLLQAIS